MKKFFNIIACLTLVIGLAACNSEFLETSPTDEYSEDFVLSNIDNLEAALNGIHKSMVAQYLSRQNIGGYPSFQIAMDCLGEDLVFPAAGNGWWTNTGEVKWTATRNPDAYLTYYPWYLCYKWIGNANMILAYVDECAGPEGQKNMLKGQALTYRANSYFWLAQLYGDRYEKGGANSGLCVPIVTDPNDPKQPLSTLADVYAQIISDLETAIPLLSDKSNAYLSYTSKTDITGATAAGIRARVALVMQDWANAQKYADMAIGSGSAKLMNQEQYCDGFNDASNPEWMWGFEMITDQTLYFYGFMAYMSWNFNSSNIRSAPKCINSKLYDQIPETDIRKTLFDPTGKAWTMPTKSFKTFPYMNRKFAVEDYTSSVADANFMRLGEMYLIAAEGAAKGGNEAAAQQYLYDLNKTRDDGYVKSTKTGADLLEEIYTYRRIELWGEGHRFLDLKRLNMALDRTGANHVAAVSSVLEIPANDERWKFAIPQDEIDANDLIDPNINK
ncbi:MAG: RagB/SusD family nutrient uptake outer membrane protein [Bacteroidales bacterium]|nr:RagB/SusD family nutrient uptake outer membrane protein [Bacteroidales bacterium]